MSTSSLSPEASHGSSPICGSIPMASNLYSNKKGDIVLPRLPQQKYASHDRIIVLQQEEALPLRMKRSLVRTISSSCPELNKPRRQQAILPPSDQGLDTPLLHTRGAGGRQKIPMSLASTPRGSPGLLRRRSGLSSSSRTSLPVSGHDESAKSVGDFPTETLRSRGLPVCRASSSVPSSPCTTPKNARRNLTKNSIGRPTDDLILSNKLKALDALLVDIKPNTSTEYQKHNQRPMPGGNIALSRGSGMSQKDLLTSRNTHGTGVTNGAPESRTGIDVSCSEPQLVGADDTDTGPESHSNRQWISQETIPGGMAPDTYERCRQWIVEVETAKKDRPLDATILPPVKWND